MEKQYCIKCASCGHLLSLENFNSKYKNNKITGERDLVKNKTCKECLWNCNQSYARFIDRHGVNYYQYRLNKN